MRGLIIMYAKFFASFGKSSSVESMFGEFMEFPDRISEIFDIIVDYPDSNCALLDLKVCKVGRVANNFDTDPIGVPRKS